MKEKRENLTNMFLSMICYNLDNGNNGELYCLCMMLYALFVSSLCRNCTIECGSCVLMCSWYVMSIIPSTTSIIYVHRTAN